MELKEVFDNRFPSNLRIRYRDIETSGEINEGLSKIWEINKVDSSKFSTKYTVKQKRKAKMID